MAKKQSKAKCSYCGAEYAKNGMTNHLNVCTKRLEAITVAEQRTASSETLFHIRAQDSWEGKYWLDLEMKGTASLKDLDSYLRAIWLECCGHLSQFFVGREWGEEIPKNRKAKQILPLTNELIHIYDFGTSSKTLIKVIGTREGKPLSRHAIELMARNLMPEEACIECGKPASWLCIECLIEEDTWGVLCDKHVKDHPHDDYGEPVGIANSPRMGMCGYNGPADPPY